MVKSRKIEVSGWILDCAYTPQYNHPYNSTYDAATFYGILLGQQGALYDYRAYGKYESFGALRGSALTHAMPSGYWYPRGRVEQVRS